MFEFANHRPGDDEDAPARERSLAVDLPWRARSLRVERVEKAVELYQAATLCMVSRRKTSARKAFSH